MSCGSTGVSLEASLRTAVFSPDSEKLASGRPSIGRGNAKAPGVASSGGAFDLRPAGVGQPEHFCHLVEGFPHGVIDGGAEAHIVADRRSRRRSGCTAGGEKQAIGKSQGTGQPRRQRMGLEMVHRDQRRVVHHRDCFRGRQPHDHAADQAGTGGPRRPRVARSLCLLPSSRCPTMQSSRSTWARAAISGTTPPKRACSSVCDRTILDKIRPVPSLRRSTTAAAVHRRWSRSRATKIRVSLPNVSSCAFEQSGVSLNSVTFRGRKMQSSVGTEATPARA